MEERSTRPFKDSEVNEVLQSVMEHPYMMAVLDYAFPNTDISYFKDIVSQCHSIQDFQSKIIYPALQRVLSETTDGLSSSGFDNLKKDQAYLYISNHRDIVLDTSLTNLVLLEKEMVMTASAIGDNLVPTDFLLAFSRLSRNFLVRRSLTPREMLVSSINLSKYIHELIQMDNRSVWLAQREGRTKDGNDQTQQGILKMLSLGIPKNENTIDYFKSLNIVPLAISYELDPTDYLKMPALMANYYEQEYVKTKNEDFNNIIAGVLGKKRRIHIAVNPITEEDYSIIQSTSTSPKETLSQLTQLITKKILEVYKLWPTNYIAHDLLHHSNQYQDFYTREIKERFESRVEKKTEDGNDIMRNNFLAMYANPVDRVNKCSLQ